MGITSPPPQKITLIKSCLLVRFLLAVINTMTRSRLGRKGFILLAVAVHHRGKPRQEVKQELMQRPWRNAAFYLAPLRFAQPAFSTQARVEHTQ